MNLIDGFNEMKKKQDKKDIAQKYDDLSGDYDAIVKTSDYAVPKWFSEKLLNLNLAKKARVLDLGCGSGIAGELVHRLRNDVELTGTDISPGMIEATRSKNIFDKLFVHDLDQPLLPYHLGKFELITAFGVLEFVDNLDHVLNEIMEHLKPGGDFFATFELSDDNGKSAAQTTLVHTAFSINEIENKLSHLGFKTQALESTLGYTSPSSGTKINYILYHGKLNEE